MYPRAGYRGHVHDRALGGLQLVDQSAREHDRREEVDLKYVVPVVIGGVERREPAAAVGFWRDSSVVDEGVQLTCVEPALDLRNCLARICLVGKVHLNVILGSGFPWTIFRKRIARTGDDAPAGGGKTLHCRVARGTARAPRTQRA